MKLRVGDFAPDFRLPDQYGKEHALSGHRGEWIWLYFYPKDNTPGCTMEACSIRDASPKLQKLKVTVLGVSVDPVESHLKFTEKYRLPFTLLSDSGKRVVEEYGIWRKKKFLGTKRTSFLIDPKGRIQRIYEKVNPINHAEQVFHDLANLQQTDILWAEDTT